MYLTGIGIGKRKVNNMAEQEKLEFRLINPTEDGFLRKIEWNKDQLEQAVRAKVEEYQNVVYTADTVNQAKEDRAELNKLIKAIEDRRKQVKKVINEPYEQFEKEVKEVLALIQEPVALIDKQVKDFEEQEKKEKRAKLEAVFAEAAGETSEVLDFEKVFDPRYLNKTYKLEDAQNEIRDKVETFKRDLETIDSLDSKYKLNAKDVYIKTLDLSQALAENKRLTDLEAKLEADRKRKEAEEQARKEAEAQRQEEEEQRKAEEEKRLADEATKMPLQGTLEPKSEENENNEAEKPENQAVTTTDERNEEEKKYRVRFEVKGTKDVLYGLIEYMKNNGIEYERI